jgi:hypothetical protein
MQNNDFYNLLMSTDSFINLIILNNVPLNLLGVVQLVRTQKNVDS